MNDAELLRAGADFQAAEGAINRILEEMANPCDDALLDFHERLTQACEAMIRLSAQSHAGISAKARILLRLLELISAKSHPRAELHERLAASLANDVLRLPVIGNPGHNDGDGMS